MDALVSTDWLAQRVGDPDLRVFETTVFLRRAEDGSVRPESGRTAWEAGHIPGTGFLDLVGELSDADAPLWFTAPDPDALAATLASAGIGAGTRVVFYDRLFNMWATRAWWLLRSIGVDDVAVLDGGVRAWTDDGRTLTDEPAPSHPQAQLDAEPRSGCFVDAGIVTEAIGDDRITIVNALSPEQHSGEDLTYGRPGHIPGACNVSATGLVDPDTHRYRPLDELRSEFATHGTTSGRVISYCGGGIAATSDAFVLHLLGNDDVGVYDGSLRDWIDRDLPLEV